MSDSELGMGSSKITSEHTRRLACVYVRQSTMQQVEHHQESQANQYRLVERAHALGGAKHASVSLTMIRVSRVRTAATAKGSTSC